jgi:uncharacterized protein YdeI (YjbR/CyaY-like superfamily)
MAKNAPAALEQMRQTLIKKLLDRKREIERQLEQLGHKEKAGS